ncbi:MAG: sulfurtransferase [Proteobacteria bacterium]|nr:sulfurtransferase [Pseudomonadota bacterium]
MPDISAHDVAAWRAATDREPPLVVDVREAWERDICALPGVHAIPLRELPARVAELPQDRDLVVVCHKGGRSAQACAWLSARGYRTFNLAGGMDAWARTVDPGMRRY